MTKIVIDKALIEQAISAIELTQENLRPHGDSCFLHDDGEYNSCFCGLDSLTQHLLTVTETLAMSLAEPVTDEENEQFSNDVSNFIGADPEATKYALDRFLKRRSKSVKALLSDEVINAEAAKHQLSTTEERHWYGDNYTVSVNNIEGANNFAKAIEQLVLQKLGLK